MEKLLHDSTKRPNSYSSTASEYPVNPDLAEIYTRALQGKEPRDGEFDAWLNVIGGYSAPDVDAAVRRWQRDTYLEEWTGRPRGSRMPTAAELKASIDAWNSATAKKFVPCGSCDNGWLRVFKGMTVGREGGKPNPIDPKVGAVVRCQCLVGYIAARTQQGPEPPKRRGKR